MFFELCNWIIFLEELHGLRQSEALDRLQNMPAVCCRWFSGMSMESIKVKIAFSMLVPFLNLNCSGTKILFDCKCCFGLLNSNVSRTLDNDSNNDIGL
jgi:hypothetical protein